MALAVRLLTRFVVYDTAEETTADRRDIESTMSAPILKIEPISLTSGFNAFTVPTGATHVIIEPLTGAVTWTLKGVTGDTGIALAAAATLPTRPTALSLGSAPALGITTNGNATARLYWF